MSLAMHSSKRLCVLVFGLASLATGCTSGIEAAGSEATERGSCRMGALPDHVALDEDVSAIAVADVDADGCTDIAAIETSVASGEVALVVAFGDRGASWDQQYRQVLAKADPPKGGQPPSLTVRDSASSV